MNVTPVQIGDTITTTVDHVRDSVQRKAMTLDEGLRFVDRVARLETVRKVKADLGRYERELMEKT